MLGHSGVWGMLLDLFKALLVLLSWAAAAAIAWPYVGKEQVARGRWSGSLAPAAAGSCPTFCEYVVM